jgi:hypothetical protein
MSFELSDWVQTCRSPYCWQGRQNLTLFGPEAPEEESPWASFNRQFDVVFGEDESDPITGQPHHLKKG